MKNFKKLLAVVLATLMIFSILPLSALAEEITEVTLADLGVSAGSLDKIIVDDPTGSGEKVIYAGAGVNNRQNVELLDKATGEKFDAVAGTVYTVKFDYYLESTSDGKNSFDFTLYYGAQCKYDPKAPKSLIASDNSGFSKSFFGDGQWHSMAMTFVGADVENVPYLYLTWYPDDTASAVAYVKNIEIVVEEGATAGYGNSEIAIGNILNTKGALVKGAGMTSNYDQNGGTVTLNADKSVSIKLVSGMNKAGTAGQDGWNSCITPTVEKGKASTYWLNTGKTYIVTIRYKVDAHFANGTIGIGYAYKNAGGERKGTSTASTTTFCVVRKDIKGATDGWETLTANIASLDATSNLKILLTGTNGNVVTLGDISVAVIDNTFTSAQFYTLNDNGQPRVVAAYVGTDITYVGNNSDNAAMGEKFIGWYDTANYMNKVTKFTAEMTAIYAKYPSTIIDFNHWSDLSSPLTWNGSNGVSVGLSNGIYNIKMNANVGAMIPAYDAASTGTVFYRFEQGVKYAITYYYQTGKVIKEEYTEEETQIQTKHDAEGNPIYKLDAEGNQIPVVGEDGNPVLDADGNPTYEVETEEVTVTVTKTRDVWTTDTGLKLNHTLASGAGNPGGRDTKREHGEHTIPASNSYSTSELSPEYFSEYTAFVTGNVTSDKTGLCIRQMNGGVNIQFRLDKIVITSYGADVIENGNVFYTVDYNDGVTAKEDVTAPYGSYNKLPIPTREGYIFAGWYKNYNAKSHVISTDDIPVTVVCANLDNLGAVYSAQWVSIETERIEFSEGAYANLGPGDKGGTISVVTDEAIDSESADNTYAMIDTVTTGKDSNFYKISLFHDDGNRFLCYEGVTYEFTVRYKVVQCYGTRKAEAIGIDRNVVGSYGPAGLDGTDTISNIVNGVVSDTFATATKSFTVDGVYIADSDITEEGVDRARTQLGLRMNGGIIYVDYVDVKAVAYTPLNDDKVFDVDYNAGTLTINPEVAGAYAYDVTALMTYRNYTIAPQVDKDGNTVIKDGKEVDYCYAETNEAVALERISGNVFKFNTAAFDASKLSAIKFDAKFCSDHVYDNEYDEDCNTCGATSAILYPEQKIDVTVAINSAVTAEKLNVALNYNSNAFKSVTAKWLIAGKNATYSNKNASIDVSEEYTEDVEVEVTKTKTEIQTVIEKVPMVDSEGEAVLDPETNEPMYEEKPVEKEVEVTYTEKEIQTVTKTRATEIPAGAVITFTFTTKAATRDVDAAVIATVTAVNGEETVEVASTATAPKYIVDATATAPVKVEYVEKTEFDATGISFTLTYSDGTTETVTEGINIFGYDAARIGTQIVTAEYKGVLAQFVVNVVARAVVSIEIATLPGQLTYVIGQILDTTGLTVSVTYDNGEVEVIEEGFTVADFDTTTAGTKTVTVEYAGATTTFEAEVLSADQAYIVLSSASVLAGETFDVYVAVNGTADILSLGIKNIAYDATKLEYVGFEWVADAAMKDWNADELKGAIAFNLYENVAVTGNVAKITFKAIDNVGANGTLVDCEVIVKALDADNNEVETQLAVYEAGISETVVAAAGDLDGNDTVDADDAIYVLYYAIYGAEEYPLNQDVDYDEDGAVTSDDAIYLLYHVVFGEELYPIGIALPPVVGPEFDGDHDFEDWIPLG